MPQQYAGRSGAPSTGPVVAQLIRRSQQKRPSGAYSPPTHPAATA